MLKIQPFPQTAQYPILEKPSAGQTGGKICPAIQPKTGSQNIFGFEYLKPYNITFTSAVKKDLKTARQNYQDKIDETREIAAPDTRVAITDYTDIDILNEVFKEDNIGAIFPTKLSLNTALKYLSKKEQIKLNGGQYYAFMIDEASVKDTGALYNALMSGKAKFYCYSNSDERAQKLINELNTKIPRFPDVKVIKKPDTEKSIKAPDFDTVEKILTIAAKDIFPDDPDLQAQYIDVAEKYLSEFFTPFSYSSICAQLRKMKGKIEREISKSDKPIEDVRYIFLDNRSSSLISYLYASENGTDTEKFIPFDELKFAPKDNTAYVLLDDICASGKNAEAMLHMMYPFDVKNSMIIVAPVVACDSAKTRIDNAAKNAKERRNTDVRFVYCKSCKDLGQTCKNGLKGSDISAENFKYLDGRDLKFLFKYMEGGASDIFSCITFPYMIPDNSSILTALIGGGFLNNNSLKANKGLAYRDMAGKYRDSLAKIEEYTP